VDENQPVTCARAYLTYTANNITCAYKLNHVPCRARAFACSSKNVKEALGRALPLLRQAGRLDHLPLSREQLLSEVLNELAQLEALPGPSAVKEEAGKRVATEALLVVGQSFVNATQDLQVGKLTHLSGCISSTMRSSYKCPP
jgi:hypothetical protein